MPKPLFFDLAGLVKNINHEHPGQTLALGEPTAKVPLLRAPFPSRPRVHHTLSYPLIVRSNGNGDGRHVGVIGIKLGTLLTGGEERAYEELRLKTYSHLLLGERPYHPFSIVVSCSRNGEMKREDYTHYYALFKSNDDFSKLIRTEWFGYSH